jgi:uncharacterized protein
MRLQIRFQGQLLSDDIRVADTFFTRLVGLMFRDRPLGDGLLLEPGNSIHTCFMRYALDVVFLDKEDRVVKIIRDLRPWRQTWIYFRSRKVLEVPAGKLPRELKEGDKLEVLSV